MALPFGVLHYHQPFDYLLPVIVTELILDQSMCVLYFREQHSARMSDSYPQPGAELGTWLHQPQLPALGPPAWAGSGLCQQHGPTQDPQLNKQTKPFKPTVNMQTVTFMLFKSLNINVIYYIFPFPKMFSYILFLDLFSVC